jgi:hypothetical protein
VVGIALYPGHAGELGTHELCSERSSPLTAMVRDNIGPFKSLLDYYFRDLREE